MGLLFITSVTVSFQNPTKYLLIKSINISASAHVTTDNLGNIYIYDGSLLTKYNSEFIQTTYSTQTFGKISFVDASNPLKILVYFEDFGQIIYLDNNLSTIGDPISINNLGFYDTRLVCSSNNNGFWLFDNSQKQIVHINNELQTDKKSGNLELQQNTPFIPSYICEQNQTLWVMVPDQGIYLFDTWGTFIKRISIKDIKQFQVNKDILLYYQNNRIHSYNTKTFEYSDNEIPTTDQTSEVRIEEKKIFIINKNKVEIFQLSL